MRAVHGSTVLYPSCATTAAELTRQMADGTASRTCGRPARRPPSCTGPGSASRSAAAAWSAAVGPRRRRDPRRRHHPARGARAHDLLQERGIAVRVVDVYSVKPIDAATVEACASEWAGGSSSWRTTGRRAACRDAVCEVFAGRPAPAITRLAVRGMPGSGTPREPPRRGRHRRRRDRGRRGYTNLMAGTVEGRRRRAGREREAAGRSAHLPVHEVDELVVHLVGRRAPRRGSPRPRSASGGCA